MANNDPGAKPVILGLLAGLISVFGGPVGLVAASVAGATAYGLGRVIRRSRESGNSKTSGSNDYSNYNPPKYEPLPSTSELIGISRPTIRNQDYNNTYSVINSIADTPVFPTDELFRIREPITRNHENHNIYTGINALVDFQHNDQQDEPGTAQRPRRRRVRIDEYGQIWEE